jgi:ketosteroid isomerase-like protein
MDKGNARIQDPLRRPHTRLNQKPAYTEKRTPSVQVETWPRVRSVGARGRQAFGPGAGHTGRVMSEESTTPDLVELMRQSVEALSRRDIDALMSFVAPDAAWDLRSGNFEGVEAIRGFLEEWLGSYEAYRVEAEEILDLGHGVAFLAYRENGRLFGSKGRVEQQVAQVVIWVSGKIEWMSAYFDPGEDRAAAERLAEERG